MGRRLDDSKRRAIADAVRAGGSVRDVAAESGVAPSTVSRIAAENAILLDGSATAAANGRRAADLRARVVQESSDVLADAQRIRRQLFERWVLHHWYQGEHFEHEVGQPTAADLKSLAIAYGILVDKALSMREFGDLMERIEDLERRALASEAER